MLPKINPNKLIGWLADIRVLILAYELIKSNAGANTPGSTEETLDGIRLKKLQEIRKKLKAGQFRFDPARRILIPKPGKKDMRPLDITSQKVVQKAIEIILTVLFEEDFSKHSHGFRTNHGVQSAIKIIKETFVGVNLIIEGDIRKCFENVKHDILLEIVAEKVKCKQTLQLIKRLLQVGYVDGSGSLHPSKKGIPQGIIPGPVLLNIYINCFDRNIEYSINKLGTKLVENSEFWKYYHLAKNYNSKGDKENTKKHILIYIFIPKIDVDKSVKLVYVRYADDFVIGITGPHKTAEKLKIAVQEWLLENLRLELNEEKTKITRGKKGFKFLGFLVYTDQRNADVRKTYTGLPIPLNSKVVIKVATTDLIKKLEIEGLVKKNRRNHLSVVSTRWKAVINLRHSEIVKIYSAKWIGIISSQMVADDKMKGLRIIEQLILISLAQTLRYKFKLSGLVEVFKKFGPRLKRGGSCRGFQPRMADKKRWPIRKPTTGVSNLITPMARLNWESDTKVPKRLLSKPCVICNNKDQTEVHFATGKTTTCSNPASEWLNISAPLCSHHHVELHKGNLRNTEWQPYVSYLMKKYGVKFRKVYRRVRKKK